MAMTGGQKALVAGGVVGVIWLLVRSAKADELPENVTPAEPDPIDEPDPPVGPPPDFTKCNFVGCPGFVPAAGAGWTEHYTALRLQWLGYQINPAVAGFSLLSPTSRAKVLHFQQNWNHVEHTIPMSPGRIDEDELVGNRTIAAIKRAQLEVQRRMQSWAVIVSLTP